MIIEDRHESISRFGLILIMIDSACSLRRVGRFVPLVVG